MFNWLFGSKEADVQKEARITLFVGDEFPEDHIPVLDGPACVKKLAEYGVVVDGSLYRPVAALNLVVEAFRRIDELEKMLGEKP